MSRLTPLILLVVVGALALLAVRQTEREAAGRPPEPTPLFQGVELRRVSAIRLENIRASRHMRFERDDAGRWFMTDPVAWAAEPGLMDKVFGVIQRNGATPVPDQLVADAAESFEPPRGFLETTEVLENGEKRKTRIEVGGLDLDGMRVYIRRDGVTLRTARNLETLFSFTEADFRSKKLFGFLGNSITKIERVGGWYDETDPEGGESLGFMAIPEGYSWRIHEPVRVLGDPVLLTLWSRFLRGAEGQRFVSDRVDVDLADYNLDQPWFSIHVTTLGGGVQTVHVAAYRDKVFARREGFPNVYQLTEDVTSKLREPHELFYESSFVRVPKDDVRHIWIQREDETIRMTRKRGDWSVAKKAAGVAAFSMELPADKRVAEDLLALAEKSEVLRYFNDVKPGEFFEAGRGKRGFWLEPYQDVRQGGYLGDLVRTPQGTEVAPFLREGDSVVGSLAPELYEVTDRPLESFLDRNLWTLQNIRMSALVIERDGSERRFKRTATDDWQPEDAAVPARELDPVLDHLLFLKADEHIAEGDRMGLEGIITVTFSDSAGTTHVARFGKSGDGRAQVITGALQATLKRPQLYDDLVALMDRKPDRPSDQ